MKCIDVVQNCVFIPLLENLELSGMSSVNILRKSGLKRFKVENVDSYIPASLFYELLNEIRNIGVDDFVAQFYSTLKVNTLSWFGENVQQMPYLFDAFKYVELNGRYLVSNEFIQLKVEGPLSIYEIRLQGKPCRAWYDLELVSLMQTIDAIRLAAGEDWLPREIHLRSKKIPNLDVIFKSNNYTKLKLGEDCTRIIFETHLLQKSMISAPKNLELFQTVSVFHESNLKNVITIIDSSKSIPTLTQLASSVGMSKNSVKRLLSKEKATFRDVIENWRIRKALEMILVPGYQIREISENLGYSNPSNFNRAFKRWTNFSPELYREGLMA